MKKYMPLILAIISIRCNHSGENSSYLKSIYIKNNWDHDGILFLTESSNIENISDDSLKFYLTDDEINMAMDSIGYPVDEDGSEIMNQTAVATDTTYERRVEFKNYGKIFTSDKISINTIFKGNNLSGGRAYQYYLRTYDKQQNLIDTILFATWDDDRHLYFSGELTDDLKVRRLNKDKKVIADFQIMDNGKIQKIKK